MAISFSSLSGGTSFTVVTSTGGSKTATLDKSYPAGTYLIESKALDTNLEVYLGASDGTPAGKTVAGAKTVTATSSFLYVTTVNADANDAVIFTLKSAASLATKTDATWAPPTITDITPSGLPNVNDTTTITGTNFASNVEVKFRKSDDSTLVTPKTTVRGSATSIIAGRPDSFAVGDAPYDVIVTNPTTTLSASSLNAITSGAVPVWVTLTTLNEATLTQSFSQTIQATDADGGSSITYAIVSGALQTGLSLNTSTGAITGTPTGSAGNTTVVISATDSGGNAVNRTFTQVITSGNIEVEYLIVAGGGGAGSNRAGGGGAGGLLTGSYTASVSTSYSVVVGARGNGANADSAIDATKGSNSSIFGFTSSGGGASLYGNQTPSNGGSGAGGTESNTGPGTAISGQGNVGGNGGGTGSGGSGSGGGGGGYSAAGSNASGNNAGAGGAGWTITSAFNSSPAFSGMSVLSSGGGGGAPFGSAGAGGTGAGNGGYGVGSNTTGNGGDATSYGSAGGGGAYGGGYGGGKGGSGYQGIVVLRYQSATQKATGGNVTNSGGYFYHTFTSSEVFNTTSSLTSSKATGGYITTDGSYYYHTFDSSGTFTPTQSLTADYLVVAGGGASAVPNGRYSGGGGAGGLRSTVTATGGGGALESTLSLTSQAYTVTVGAGGAANSRSPGRGSNGVNSSIIGGAVSITSIGGGAGGAGDDTNPSGLSGGSGGGGTSINGAGGSRTTNQGYAGGSSTTLTASGGGGAGAAGGNETSSAGGAGGNGVQITALATATGTGSDNGYYAGGGAGGGGTRGNGGLGGGGYGVSATTNSPAIEGLPNTGGGGGGNVLPFAYGNNGGSGIVIIRYPV